MRWGWVLDNVPFHDHLNLAHYANAACDIQFNFPMGFRELEGIHSRTDFDLRSHEKFSGKKLQYFDPETNHTISRTSWKPRSVSTACLAVLSNAYREETLAAAEGKEEGNGRVVLSLPPALAPHSVAVLPARKDGLPEKAEMILTT